MSIGIVFGAVLLLAVQAEVPGRQGLERWVDGVTRHVLPGGYATQPTGRDDTIHDANAGGCGLWSADLALRLAGSKPPALDELARMLKIEQKATSVYHLVQAFRSAGFRGADAVRLVELSALADLPLPAVAYLHPTSQAGQGHFVVLAARENGHVQIIDYPRYVAWIPAERLALFDDIWQGEVVLLLQTPRPWTPWRAAGFGASCAWLCIGVLMVVRLRVRRFTRTCQARPAHSTHPSLRVPLAVER